MRKYRNHQLNVNSEGCIWKLIYISSINFTITIMFVMFTMFDLPVILVILYDYIFTRYFFAELKPTLYISVKILIEISQLTQKVNQLSGFHKMRIFTENYFHRDQFVNAIFLYLMLVSLLPFMFKVIVQKRLSFPPKLQSMTR